LDFLASFVSVVIALLIQLPQTLAAVQAALRERIQISLKHQARAARLDGFGIGRPVVRAASNHASMACSTSATASWGTGPCAEHIGRSGASAIQTPSSSLHKTSIG
jgi:hypothetical protein